MTADGTPMRIDALATDGSEGTNTADVEILPPQIILESRRGIDITLDDDQLVEMPPLLIVSGHTPYLGFLVSKLKIDLSTQRSPAKRSRAASTRPGAACKR